MSDQNACAYQVGATGPYNGHRAHACTSSAAISSGMCTNFFGTPVTEPARQMQCPFESPWSAGATAVPFCPRAERTLESCAGSVQVPLQMLGYSP